MLSYSKPLQPEVSQSTKTLPLHFDTMETHTLLFVCNGTLLISMSKYVLISHALSTCNALLFGMSKWAYNPWINKTEAL